MYHKYITINIYSSNSSIPVAFLITDWYVKLTSICHPHHFLPIEFNYHTHVFLRIFLYNMQQQS